MITKAHARQLRAKIVKASSSLPDTDALQAVELFDEWKAETAYTVQQRIRYHGKLYRCEQAHTSQSDWTPDKTPALWVRVDDPGEEWPEWRQPTGATDAYYLGAKVSHNSKHWISDIDGNVWEPGVYGWTEAE